MKQGEGANVFNLCRILTWNPSICCDYQRSFKEPGFDWVSGACHQSCLSAEANSVWPCLSSLIQLGLVHLRVPNRVLHPSTSCQEVQWLQGTCFHVGRHQALMESLIPHFLFSSEKGFHQCTQRTQQPQGFHLIWSISQWHLCGPYPAPPLPHLSSSHGQNKSLCPPLGPSPHVFLGSVVSPDTVCQARKCESQVASRLLI